MLPRTIRLHPSTYQRLIRLSKEKVKSPDSLGSGSRHLGTDFHGASTTSQRQVADKAITIGGFVKGLGGRVTLLDQSYPSNVSRSMYGWRSSIEEIQAELLNFARP
jgi:hypothetical protein